LIHGLTAVAIPYRAFGSLLSSYFVDSAQGQIACSAEGAAFNSHGRQAVGYMSKQIEARRADIFIGNIKSMPHLRRWLF
jgi:hypothetical protein